MSKLTIKYGMATGMPGPVDIFVTPCHYRPGVGVGSPECKKCKHFSGWASLQRIVCDSINEDPNGQDN